MFVSPNEIFNPIEGKLEDLIALFTEYFGSKHKLKIANNLHNTEFFFLDKNPVETIKSLYNDHIGIMLTNYRNDIGLPHLKNYTVEDYKQLLISIVVGDIGSDAFIKICELASALNMDVFDYDSIDDFLNYPSNANKLIAKLNKSIDIWHKKYENQYSALLDEYSKYTAPFVEAQEELDDIEDYYEGLITEVYCKHLDRHLINRDNISFQNFFLYKKLLQSAVSIGKDHLNSDFLVDPSLTHQFMDFFRALGFNYGSNFDAYMADEDLQNILFDDDVLDKIYSLKKEKYVTSFMHNQQFLDAAKRLDSADTLGGSYNLLASICMYLSSTHMGGFTQAHLTKDKKLKHFCVCPLGAGLSDNTFIHEAGHAAAGSVVNIMPNKFVDKSGIDVSTIDISNLEFSFDTLFDRVKVTNSSDGLKQTHREYHILNEVIHDYMIQEILALAKKKGLKFGLLPNDKVQTQYSYAFPLVKDFIERYKPFLKDAIMSDDPNMLANFMGRDNLDSLAHIVEECVNFPNNIRSSVMTELMYQHNLEEESLFDIAKLSGKKWSKHTSKYLDLYRQANEVYANVQNKDGM